MAKTGNKITINRVTLADLTYAFTSGVRDFFRAPLFGLFFGAFYMLGGLALIWGVITLNSFWLAYPLVIGFALVGPFIATGLYEVSRRMEQGGKLVWGEVLNVIVQQHRRELGWMAFVMLFIFWVWMYQARTLFAVFFGFSGFADLQGFLDVVLTTQNGWNFLLVGHAVGAVISLVLFSLTVVSCPLLLERDVDFVTAMITSIRTVFKSPIVMLGWGAFVILTVLVSAIPAFAGLLVTLPVLGHATWHLYRRAIT